MAEKIKLSDAEIEQKLLELKVEVLKQNSKRKVIKREIARLLTVKNQNKRTKSVGDKK